MLNLKIYCARTFSKLTALFGRGMVISVGVILLVVALVGIGIFAYLHSSAPTVITLSSGPAGSSFEKNAAKYKKILVREGVSLNILPSEGSVENLKRLADPKLKVDVGFVLGGLVEGTNTDHLVSLGSVSYQPLLVFYRGKPKALLSEFKGKRLDIDEVGSGTHALALTLLKANGIEANDGTVIMDTVKGDPVQSLIDNRVDAIFVMGDSTSSDVIRKLLHTPEVRLFNFTQADAYARRIPYLNKLEMPKGALDFGKNIPEEDVSLVAPAVELVARDTLHPALSDVLLEAAKEVHGNPGLFRKRAEFPSPVEREFRISEDATRYYTSGKSYLYRMFPFWVASLVARVLAVVVPMMLLLIPALKMAPAIYKWRIQSRINRWYRVLLELERDAFKPACDPERRAELLRHLDHIEDVVNKISVPASFGDVFYGLRGHIGFVRAVLLAKKQAIADI